MFFIGWPNSYHSAQTPNVLSGKSTDVGELLGGHLNSAVSSALGQWLDSEETPHAIVDRDGRLQWANRAATEISLGALEVTDKAVRARERAHHERLLDAFERAGPTLKTLVLSDEVGHTVLRLAEVGRPLREDWIGIRWTCASDSFKVRYAAVEDVFQLTPAEHSVLMSLAMGMTAEEVASSSGKSLGTVRSHIRQIYGKLSVKSREQMLFRIQPFRI
ncbi:MAG: LuxR family transcriptional regulator [Alphaproteobacteria bacterium]|nr:MAG: LuxR family transcriptional regulator [Alphaproteobacteria bacterium]